MESPTLFIQKQGTLDNAFEALFPTTDELDGSIWYSGHTIPAYISCVSAIIVVVHALAASPYIHRFVSRSFLEEERDSTPCDKSHIQAHGGRIIFAADILRLVGCFELFHLSISRFLAIKGPAAGMLGISCVPFVCDIVFMTSID